MECASRRFTSPPRVTDKFNPVLLPRVLYAVCASVIIFIGGCVIGFLNNLFESSRRKPGSPELARVMIILVRIIVPLQLAVACASLVRMIYLRVEAEQREG